MNKTGEAFERLVDIMNELREQCPWDKKQTIQTLRQMTLEETYELTDAITDANWKGIKEELGDLLLHIVFYSKIGTEQNQFTIEEVINGICDKLDVRKFVNEGVDQIRDHCLFIIRKSFSVSFPFPFKGRTKPSRANINIVLSCPDLF